MRNIENGDKYWYVNDQLHRYDGPAVERSDGSREWWLNNKRQIRTLHCLAEYCRILNATRNIRQWIPIQSSGKQFPLYNLVTDYIQSEN
jgi:hypothetical protein